ncbi:MAG: DUF503 domain-containing protein [Myxococcota bacterium]|jgi:hypothetical protein|nr:DUF503 domain-containing protein [Myxococcota bacterium]
MFVGVLRIALHLPGNDSLKGKRRIVRSFVDRVRAKFNAAVAEVGENDEHRRAIIGLSVVSNDASHVHAMLGKLASFTRAASGAEVWDISTQTLAMADHLEPLLPSVRDGDDGDFTDEDTDWSNDEEATW